MVDPNEPSLVAWELRDDSYVQVARADGTGSFTTRTPIELTFAPADLVR